MMVEQAPLELILEKLKNSGYMVLVNVGHVDVVELDALVAQSRKLGTDMVSHARSHTAVAENATALGAFKQ
nr:hypothetical protein [Ensifer aridi]